MRKLLMMAYHFPPLTTSGMYRSFEFARYLPRYGWSPVVLTTRPEKLLDPGLLDSTPLKILPDEVRVVRATDAQPLRMALHLRDRLRNPDRMNGGNGSASTPTVETTGSWKDWITDFLSLPDRQAGWIPAAAVRAIRLLSDEEFDCIYSSSPPASVHVAALLAARSSGIPWVADFRDPWISNRFTRERCMAFLDPVDKHLEEAVVKNARRIIVNTEELCADFQRRYPYHATRFVTIPNGFDPEEAIPVHVEESAGKRPFTIIHAGGLYGRRDPTPIFRAVATLLERGVVAKDGIRIRLLGTEQPTQAWEKFLRERSLETVVQFERKVPRAQALASLAASDLLLLIQAGTVLQVPRKVYDYMAAGRPILAMVTSGATENLVRKENLGWIAHPDDPEAIERCIENAIRGRSETVVRRSGKFDFRNLTGRLVRQLEDELV